MSCYFSQYMNKKKSSISVSKETISNYKTSGICLQVMASTIVMVLVVMDIFQEVQDKPVLLRNVQKLICVNSYFINKPEFNIGQRSQQVQAVGTLDNVLWHSQLVHDYQVFVKYSHVRIHNFLGNLQVSLTGRKSTTFDSKRVLYNVSIRFELNSKFNLSLIYLLFHSRLPRVKL